MLGTRTKKTEKTPTKPQPKLRGKRQPLAISLTSQSTADAW